MISKSHLLCIALFSVCPGLLIADDPAGDPLHEHLFPPNLLMQHRVEIGLTHQQVETIRARVEEVGPKMQQRQTRINDAMGKLAQLLAVEKVDEEAALKQLDEVLAIEKELKHMHFRVMIQIRNELNTEQQKIAAKLDRSPQHAKGLEQRLKAKIARIEKAVQSRAQAGRPPLDVIDLMQKLPKFMQKGQVKEAEALLDRALKLLGVKDADKATDKPQPGSPSSRAKPAAEAKTLSPEAVRTEVAALKKEDVAWRKIAWKTCLLDGLKASREQHKPVMLWIFIDRPIDDERC